MGNVTLEVGPTDRKITAWLAAYFESQPKPDASKMSTRELDAIVTQTRLARAIGMSESRMSRRMSGDLPWQNADIDRIADFLGVDGNEIRNGPRKKK